jgi:hypothetical protein
LLLNRIITNLSWWTSAKSVPSWNLKL